MKTLSLMALAAMTVTGAQAYSLFDFESSAATSTTFSHPGALTSLSQTDAGLTLVITRSGGATFDVLNNFGGGGTFPLTWDARSLDPFQAQINDYFVGNFSNAVNAVELEMTD